MRPTSNGWPCHSLSSADPEDEWDRWAILAVQGPESFGVFESVFPEAEQQICLSIRGPR